MRVVILALVFLAVAACGSAPPCAQRGGSCAEALCCGDLVCSAEGTCTTKCNICNQDPCDWIREGAVSTCRANERCYEQRCERIKLD